MARAVFWAAALLCLLPQVSGGPALVLGLAVALASGNPYAARTKPLASRMLAWSIVGLGAGMNLAVVGRAGLQGLAYTVAGICATLLIGAAVGKALQVERDTAVLISVGTAICGGSAIAAASCALRAKPHKVSVALATVFCLNAAALLLFPWIGHALGLSQRQFGLWSALAIHDTSSVVGAAMQYGAQALEIATTVKLARALWIVPVTMLLSFLYAGRAGEGAEAGAPKRPWFILGFLAAAALVTWLPGLAEPGRWAAAGAKRMLVVTLFLIGAGISRESLRGVGVRPFAQGILLWFCAATGTLGAVLAGWIR